MTNHKKSKKRTSSESGNYNVKVADTQSKIKNKKRKTEKNAGENGEKLSSAKSKDVNMERPMTKREKRQIARREKGQNKVQNITLSADKLREKIKLMTAMETLSKTARRKLGLYKKKLAIETGADIATVKLAVKEKKKQPVQSKNKNKRGMKKASTEDAVAVVKTKSGSMIRIQANKKTKNKKQNPMAMKQVVVGKKKKNNKAEVNVKKEVDNEEDEDDDEDGNDNDDDDEEVDPESEDDDVDAQYKEEEDNEDGNEEEVEDDDSETDEDDSEADEDDSEADEDEDVLTVNEPPSTVNKVQGSKEKNAGKQEPKKKRYVLFVGNLPFDLTTDELKNHFLTKVSAVESIRIPPKPGSNQSRGIAYAEFTNDIDLEKALSFHHTFLKGRRINVQYTAGGSNPAGHKPEIVAKNKKLHALRQAGKLAGSPQRGGARFTPMGRRPNQRT